MIMRSRLLVTHWNATAEGVVLQRPYRWLQCYHLSKNHVSSFCSLMFNDIYITGSTFSNFFFIIIFLFLCRWLCQFLNPSFLNNFWWPSMCPSTSSSMSANPSLPTCLAAWMIFLTFPSIPRKLLKHSWLHFIGLPKRHLLLLVLTHPFHECDWVRNSEQFSELQYIQTRGLYQIFSSTQKIYITLINQLMS